jgi:hypothetical protein
MCCLVLSKKKTFWEGFPQVGKGTMKKVSVKNVIAFLLFFRREKDFLQEVRFAGVEPPQPCS